MLTPYGSFRWKSVWEEGQKAPQLRRLLLEGVSPPPQSTHGVHYRIVQQSTDYRHIVGSGKAMHYSEQEAGPSASDFPYMPEMRWTPTWDVGNLGSSSQLRHGARPLGSKLPG